MAEIWDEIKKVAKDLASLEVRTFTGDINTVPQGQAGTALNKLAMKDLMNKTTADIQVVAITQSKLDGDVDQFFQKNADEKLLRAHREALQAGRETRAALFDFFKSVAKNTADL